MCVAYEVDGQRVEQPARQPVACCTGPCPIYETLPGLGERHSASRPSPATCPAKVARLRRVPRAAGRRARSASSASAPAATSTSSSRRRRCGSSSSGPGAARRASRWCSAGTTRSSSRRATRASPGSVADAARGARRRPVRRRPRGAARRRPGRPAAGRRASWCSAPAPTAPSSRARRRWMKELVDARPACPPPATATFDRVEPALDFLALAPAALRREDRRPGRRQGRARHRRPGRGRGRRAGQALRRAPSATPAARS